MYDLATQRHTETWTGTDYANAATDIKYGYPGAPGLGELASVTVLRENGATPSAVQSSTIYDAAGNASTTTLPNTVHEYDVGGRLTSSFDSATGVTTTYSYKPNSNYLQEIKTVNSAGTVLSDDTYTYRADGLKTAATEFALNADGSSDTVTLAWQYDGLDRLTQEVSVDAGNPGAPGNYTDQYSYDLDSARVQEQTTDSTGATDTITPSYPGAAAHPRPGASAGFRGVEHYFPPACRAAPLNANDELTQTVDANNGTTTYGYDANGSQTSVSSPTGTTTNIYDLQGRLASVTNKDTSGAVTSSATYIYDDQGNPDPRISPAEIGTGLLEQTTVTGSNAPVATYFLVDTVTPAGYPQVIEQSATPGQPDITYVWGVNLISQNNAAGTANAGRYYFIVDAHAGTVALTDANGNVVQTFHYDSFGNALGFAPSSAITQYLYTQQYFDLASSTYYDWARNYNPTTGEFTQADYGNYGTLADPMSMLPYAFTGGDPVNMMDLTGHISLMSVSLTLGISAMLTGTTFGVIDAIGAPKGGGVEGFFAGFAEGALFGLEAGTALSLAAAEGALPQVIIAGVLGGVASDLVDEFSWRAVNFVRPQPSPGAGQLTEDFISGFAGSALSTALKGGVGVVEGAAVSSLISFIGQEAHNLGSPNPTPIGTVLTNSLISGVISAIVGGTMHLTFPPEVKDAFENPKAIEVVTNVVSTFISVEAGIIIKEAELLW